MYRRVGIDIDNTLTLLDSTLLEMSKYYNKPLCTPDMVKSYNISDIYGIKEPEARKFWKDREYILCQHSEIAKSRVRNIFLEFVRESTKIYIITNRDIKYYLPTLDWLEKHRIPYDELIMTSGNSKIEVLKRHRIDLMIDDKPELFYEARQERIDTKMVCVDYEFNKNVPCDIRIDTEGNVIYGKDKL